MKSSRAEKKKRIQERKQRMIDKYKPPAYGRHRDIKIHIGIGDILCVRSVLDNAIKSGKLDTVNIGIDYDLIRTYRNNSADCRTFTEQLVASLYGSAPYKIATLPGGSISHMELTDRDGYAPAKPWYPELLCGGTPLDVGPYIVVTTKIRYIPRDTYNKIRPQYVEVLKQLSIKYKIVIMGEKNISSNYENDLFGKNVIYSIYDDLKDLPNVLDLSAGQSTDFDFKSFKQDCLIMNKAVRTVVMGEGGNVAIALSVSNTIGYRVYYNAMFLENLFKNPRQQNAYVTTNANDFISELRSLI